MDSRVRLVYVARFLLERVGLENIGTFSYTPMA